MLYLVTGLPRSGKSTFCEKADGIIINVDTVRKVACNTGAYNYPFDANREPTVLANTATLVAQLVVDNPSKDVYVDDYAMLYTTTLQEEFMQAVSAYAGKEVPYVVKRVNTHPAVCIERLTYSDVYLAPIIMAQAVQDMKIMFERANYACMPESPGLLPGVAEFSAGLFDASNAYQNLHREAMLLLDPRA